MGQFGKVPGRVKAERQTEQDWRVRCCFDVSFKIQPVLTLQFKSAPIQCLPLKRDTDL